MSLLANSRCANCNTRLDGPFCHNCGQREESRVPTVRSVLGEVTNALFGLESKLWRSLWVLLTKPGLLTVEFLQGKRQKYTTPFRLYLLLSILVFAYLAILGEQASINLNIPEIQEQSTQQTEGSEDQTKNNDQSHIDNMQIELGFLSAENEKQAAEKIKGTIKEIERDIKAGKAKQVLAHFIAPLPKALLIFLPFVAIFLKIIFLGRGKYYLEHLVYLLHNHAFLFAILLLTIALNQLSNRIASIESVVFGVNIFVWLIYVPYYFYRSIKRVYESSRFGTILYLIIIFFVYLFLFLFMVIFSAFFAGFTYT